MKLLIFVLFLGGLILISVAFSTSLFSFLLSFLPSADFIPFLVITQKNLFIVGMAAMNLVFVLSLWVVSGPMPGDEEETFKQKLLRILALMIPLFISGSISAGIIMVIFIFYFK